MLFVFFRQQFFVFFSFLLFCTAHVTPDAFFFCFVFDSLFNPFERRPAIFSIEFWFAICVIAFRPLAFSNSFFVSFSSFAYPVSIRHVWCGFPFCFVIAAPRNGGRTNLDRKSLKRFCVFFNLHQPTSPLFAPPPLRHTHTHTISLSYSHSGLFAGKLFLAVVADQWRGCRLSQVLNLIRFDARS